jgi:glycerol-3-phosphate dehydrogenase
MAAMPSSPAHPAYDVAIIGGGVVGSAVFREFVLAGARTILLEQDADLLNGASKGNSGLLHTGFDATPGTIEAQCVRDGYQRYCEIAESLGLPLLVTGAMVIAWSEEEAARLEAIVATARENGVHDVRLLSAAEVLEREGELARRVVAGVLVPGEAVIDPWSAPLAYVLQGLANGGTVRRGAAVEAGRFEDGSWHLATRAGEIHAGVVVNCAGNHGDIVEAIARESPFHIRPRKGQFVVFDKSAYPLARAIILPVPTERTKGVVVSRTAFGNLIVGPTAEDQDERRLSTVEEATLRRLVEEGCRILPRLADHQVTAVYAGLRPATESKDYRIEALRDLNWITASGIRSTGLTGSLGIAARLLALHAENFGTFTPIADPVWTPVHNLAEFRPRPYEASGHGEIVCHCESVTRGEIESAFLPPLPVATLGGLKRRTRAMMGRCQGFYCSRRVAELAEGRCTGLPKPGPLA